MKKKAIFYGLIVIFASIFLYCAVSIIVYFVESKQQQDYLDNLGNLFATTAPTTPDSSQSTIPSGSIPVSPPEPGASVPAATMPPMLEEMKEAYRRNEHVVGRIRIEGTPIDYPVMQTPNTADWQNYYLYRDFDGNYSKYGSIYAREACDVFGPSDNITIYGHCMADLKMFGSLVFYIRKSYYQEHPLVQFDTLYEHNTYRIFAVFTTSGTTGVGYPYHLFDKAANQAAFDDFVATCKGMSMYDTGITPTYGDELLTLSTCYFFDPLDSNSRLVVMAVRED